MGYSPARYLAIRNCAAGKFLGAVADVFPFSDSDAVWRTELVRSSLFWPEQVILLQPLLRLLVAS